MQRAGTTVAATESDVFGQWAATRAIGDLRCRRAGLQVQALGASTYRVSGCGASATYTCTTQMVGWGFSARREVVCVAQPDGRPAPRVWSNDELIAAIRGVQGGVDACVVAEHRPARIVIGFSEQGAARALRWLSEATSAEQECVDAVFAPIDLEGVAATRTVTVRFDGAGTSGEEGDAGDGGDANAAPSDAPPAAAAAPASEYAQSLRRAVDERAASIMTCTDGAQVALAVEWSANGVTVSIRGPLHGTEVEGCVAALTQDLPRPAAAEPSGRLLHVVHQ